MIRFNLPKLLNKSKLLVGRKITLKEVSEKSGCDKNALSRMVNHPEVIPSATVIDKLVQYFFLIQKEAYEAKKGKTWLKGWRERRLMENVVRDFVSVYPDSSEYWDALPQEIKNTPNSTTLDAIWSMYERLASAHPLERFKDPLTSTTIDNLVSKLKVAREKVTPAGVNITLSEDEFELVFNGLPSLVEHSASSPSQLDKPAAKKRKKSN